MYISAYLEFAPEATRSVRSGISSSGIWSGCCPAVWTPCLPSTAGSAGRCPSRQGRRETEVPLDQIYYLESDLRKINVYGETLHKPLCSYYGKLTDLPASLQEDGFLRVGRSFVVNMRYIRADQQL